MLKVSFDFDGTLSNNQSLQMLAKFLVLGGHDVWILTSRFKEPIERNKDLYDIMHLLQISKTNVVFNSDKLAAFKEYKFELHFDDDHIDVDLINEAFPDNKPALLVGFDNRFLQHFVNHTLDEY
jgi:hypothetical protein